MHKLVLAVLLLEATDSLWS